MKKLIKFELCLTEKQIELLLEGLKDYAQACYDDSDLKTGALFEFLFDLITDKNNETN